MNSSTFSFHNSRSLWLIALFLFHTVWAFGAGWLIWGWLTISDIRRWCESNHRDYETVIRDFSTSIVESMSRESNGTVSIINKEKGPLSRLNVGTVSYELSSSQTNSVGEFKYIETFPLHPFISNSDNVVNTWFCAAIGYLMGFLTLLSQFSANREIPMRQIFLRPIISSGSSALLYIVVLSGGAMLWTNAPALNSVGLGVIAVVGAIQGEKLLRRIGSIKEPIGNTERTD